MLLAYVQHRLTITQVCRCFGHGLKVAYPRAFPNAWSNCKSFVIGLPIEHGRCSTVLHRALEWSKL